MDILSIHMDVQDLSDHNVSEKSMHSAHVYFVPYLFQFEAISPLTRKLLTHRPTDAHAMLLIATDRPGFNTSSSAFNLRVLTIFCIIYQHIWEDDSEFSFT